MLTHETGHKEVAEQSRDQLPSWTGLMQKTDEKLQTKLN